MRERACIFTAVHVHFLWTQFPAEANVGPCSPPFRALLTAVQCLTQSAPSSHRDALHHVQLEAELKRQAAEDGLDMALHVRDCLCLIYLGLPLPLLLTLHSVATDFDSLCHCLRS